MRIPTYTVVVIVLLLSVLLHTTHAQDEIGPEWKPGGITYQLEGEDGDDPIDECEVCMSFWQPDADPEDDGIFRFMFAKFNELNSEGGECCTPPFGCDYGPGCDEHVVYLIPPVLNQYWETTTNFNDTVVYNGTLSSLHYQSGTCTPPGNSVSMCVNTQFTFQVITNAQDVTIGPSNFSLQPNSMRMKVRMSNWPFAAGSTGLRIMMMLSTRRVSATDFLIQPGDISAKDAPFDGEGFDAATVVDFNTRRAQVSFPKYAIVNGMPLLVNVTGPHNPKNQDRQARWFYVDIPRFNSYEYEVNVYVPEDSGTPDPYVNKKRQAVSIIIITVACAAGTCGLCLLCGASCKLYHKFCRKHKKRQSVEMA